MNKGQVRQLFRFVKLVIATGAVCCAFAVQALAADPGTTNGKATLPCVLLKNGNVIEGVARQVGHQVIIDGSGGQISLRYDEVACWGNSLQDLYRYRVDHRQGDSNSARINDAKWCLRHGLLDEAQAAMVGVHARAQRSRQWQQLAQRIMRQRMSSITNPIVADPTPKQNIRTVGFDQLLPTNGIDQPINDVAVSADQLSRFTRDVQPMLLNRCSRCHHMGVESKFLLTRPTGSRRASAGLTQRNLHAVSPYLNHSLTSAKSLYRMATEPHGPLTTAPLTKREQTAIDNLRDWLLSIEGQTNAKDDVTLSSSPPLVDQVPSLAEESSAIDVEPSIDEVRADDSDAPARLPTIEDPFDPERFNRQSQR